MSKVAAYLRRFPRLCFSVPVGVLALIFGIISFFSQRLGYRLAHLADWIESEEPLHGTTPAHSK